MAFLTLAALGSYYYLYNGKDTEKLKPNPTRDFSDVFAIYTNPTNKGKLKLKYPDPSVYGMRGEINHKYGYVPKILSSDLTPMAWNRVVKKGKKSFPMDRPGFVPSYQKGLNDHYVKNNGWGMMIFMNPIYTGDSNQFGPQQLNRAPYPNVTFAKGDLPRKQFDKQFK
jgi:hypothetical protein